MRKRRRLRPARRAVDNGPVTPQQRQVDTGSAPCPLPVWHGGAVDDPFDLQRFVDAQDRVYDRVLAELRAGAKRSHWIWFIFPQLSRLGSSSTANLFGIESLDEARAYLAHPVLGPRLRDCARLVTSTDGRSAEDIFGWPDNIKLRSSMTLFARATDDNADFLAVLEKFYGGQQDPRTLELI
jgi:uncharacterized protein (DUF1810 family)